MNKDAFIGQLLPAAIEASKRTGIDPRIIVAQAAQETGWGRSAPGNNYFGIKSHGKPGGQTFATHEVINGQRVGMNDSFRQFDSPADSVSGYADFMTENPRYRPMREAQGLDAQLAALGSSGYATDPNYAQSVGSIARSIPLDGNYPSSQHPSHDPRIGQMPDVQLAGIETGGGMAGIPPEVAAYATSDDESPLKKIGAALSGMRGPGTPAPRAPSMSGMGGASDGSGLLQLLNQSPQMMADVLYARRQGQA